MDTDNNYLDGGLGVEIGDSFYSDLARWKCSDTPEPGWERGCRSVMTWSSPMEQTVLGSPWHPFTQAKAIWLSDGTRIAHAYCGAAMYTGDLLKYFNLLIQLC